ncbi:MAG: alpha-L-fucosidase [Ilumatobacter sp.]
MTMPTWWSEQRFGLFVHATAATVPAWAPVGQQSQWYRSHLGDDVVDVVLHPSPMVEVLAHHRDRWGHVEHYDDFVPLLTFEHFDAEAWASLARDAGAGYSVLVAKHHDGWAWWDAPSTDRKLTERGPRRDVVAEYAAACERHGITFGTYFSLLDWGDERYGTDEFVEHVVHPQVMDLVEGHGTAMLWGDGHWGRDAGYWRTEELLERVRASSPDIIINDRWRASQSDVPDGAPGIVRTFDHCAPDDITEGPWELTRSVGLSFGHNRAEQVQHHMTGLDIVDLYTEVLAKGGNLLLSVGPDAQGSVSDLQAGPLRSAGAWIREHSKLLAGTTPWRSWGDRTVRYLRAGDDVIAIDLTGAGRFDDITDVGHHVQRVELIDGNTHHGVDHRLDRDGLQLAALPAPTPLSDEQISVGVYRIVLTDAEPPNELFAPTDASPTPLGPLLANATAGDIVQLGDGVYIGPGVVPAGVILRGLGADRSAIHAGPAPESIVPAPPVLRLERNARVEHLTVTGHPTRSHHVAPPLVSIPEAFAALLGCTIHGVIDVAADDALLRAVTAQGVVAAHANRLHVSRCSFKGNGWNVGVELRGGEGHHIESSEFDAHLCAVRVSATTGSTIRGNTIQARWWGVHLDHTEDAHVHANRVHWTMRAVDVDGGTNGVVDGNAVIDGDSGCIVQDGASDCEVYGNHWDRCRVGLLAWNATALDHRDNVFRDGPNGGAPQLFGP